MFMLAWLGILVLPITLGIISKKWYIGVITFFVEIIAIMEYETKDNFYKYVAMVTWGISILAILFNTIMKTTNNPISRRFLSIKYRISSKLGYGNTKYLYGGIGLLLIAGIIILYAQGFEKLLIYFMGFILLVLLIIGIVYLQFAGAIIAIVIFMVLFKPIELFPIPVSIILTIVGVGLIGYYIKDNITETKRAKIRKKEYEKKKEEDRKNSSWETYKSKRAYDSILINNATFDISFESLAKIKIGSLIHYTSEGLKINDEKEPFFTPDKGLRYKLIDTIKEDTIMFVTDKNEYNFDYERYIEIEIKLYKKVK